MKVVTFARFLARGVALCWGAGRVAVSGQHVVVGGGWAPTVVPELLFRGRVSGRTYSMWNAQEPIRRLCYYLAALLTDRGRAKETRLLGLGASLLERFRRAQVGMYREERRIAGIEVRGLGMLGLLSVAGTVAIWIWAAVDAMSGALAIGTLVLVFQSAERARAQLQDSARGAGMLIQSRLHAQSYF